MVVAPATPPGTSALAVVRLTGPAGKTVRVVRRFAPDLPDPLPPRAARLSRVLSVSGAELDQAVVLFFEGPRSATGEDVVEIHCHGSPAVVRGLLEAARVAGARPARPGDFTRRAFEHGKVDLAAAEGIALLSAADCQARARRAFGLVRGDLSRKVEELRERLLDLLSRVEAFLDFPDDVGESEGGTALANLLDDVDRLAACRAYRPGDAAPVVVIAGRPNAGKSSLFNSLVGSDRAIVSAEAGTTRDAIGEDIELGGERLRLYDTAGLGEMSGAIERLGMEAAERTAARADLVLWLADGAVEEGDAASPGGGPSCAAGRMLLVETKRDLWGSARLVSAGAVGVSAVTGEGLDELRRRMAETLMLQENDGELLLLERHRNALVATGAALREAAGLGEGELLAAALRRALSALGEITGETASEELIDRIFSRFCVGK